MFKPRHAKQYHHELRLSANIGNRMDKTSYRQMYDQTCRTLSLEEYDTWYCGIGFATNFSASLSYFYHFSQQWALGIIGGTGEQPFEELAYTPQQTAPDRSAQEYAGYIKATSWFVMPTAKFHWAFFDSSRLYSKAALGGLSQHNFFHAERPFQPASKPDKRTWRLAYQLSLLGIEAGKGHLRGFGEVGFGMEGIVNFGLSYHL